MTVKIKTILIVVGFILCFTLKTFSQQKENSIFWEVSGNGLKEPSYLFGTIHVFTSAYIDSLPLVKNKLDQCKAVAGEILNDSMTGKEMMQAAILKNTTLDQLLSKSTYKKTDKWLKELGGYNLSMFNSMNPTMVYGLLIILVQQKYYPQPQGIGMDDYFLELGEKSNKKVIGLESVQDDIDALFGQFSYKRQAEILEKTVEQKDETIKSLGDMLNAYRMADFNALYSLMYKDNIYTPHEMKILLEDRNNNWMKKLPQLFSEQATFVAVGALHLSGEKGLVQLLREKGYTVKAIHIK